VRLPAGRVAELRDLVEPEAFVFQGVEGSRWHGVVKFRPMPTR
jgi:hypothetical protein